jgi:DNA-binding protein HU-beta
MPTKKPKPQTLSQSEFITEVAKSQKVHKIKVYNAIKLIKLGATDVLKHRKSFRLFELASFNIVERKAQQGRNPRTGEKMDISAHTAVNITPSRVLKTIVRGAEQKAKPKKKKSK